MQVPTMLDNTLQNLWTSEAFRWYEVVQHVLIKLLGPDSNHPDTPDVSKLALDKAIQDLQNRAATFQDRLTKETVQYSLGFAEVAEKPGIYLLIKNKKDGLNGLGGPVKPGETPRQSMTREFLEKSGLNTLLEAWKKLAVLQTSSDGPQDYQVHVYHTTISLAEAQSAKNSDPNNPVSLYYNKVGGSTLFHLEGSAPVTDVQVAPSLFYLFAILQCTAAWRPGWYLTITENIDQE